MDPVIISVIVTATARSYGAETGVRFTVERREHEGPDNRYNLEIGGKYHRPVFIALDEEALNRLYRAIAPHIIAALRAQDDGGNEALPVEAELGPVVD